MLPALHAIIGNAGLLCPLVVTVWTGFREEFQCFVSRVGNINEALSCGIRIHQRYNLPFLIASGNSLSDGYKLIRGVIPHMTPASDRLKVTIIVSAHEGRTKFEKEV
jgi:hypothetical protein